MRRRKQSLQNGASIRSESVSGGGFAVSEHRIFPVMPD
ncbi:conserved hypothetical protein [Burkholderia pseudomallei 576]|nr:conserved hypothetical protein [Burkholderia pseudomallei 576]KGS20800.1 hypothetical protein X941_5743 [Burkholderia pseudomallei MSHR5569]